MYFETESPSLTRFFHYFLLLITLNLLNVIFSKVAERLDLLLFERPFIIKTNCVFSGLGEVE